MSDLKWGLVSTIKAPAQEILRFAAYHLEAGAHRLYIYLDADNPNAFKALKSHPKCRVTTCDQGYWKQRGNRPQKHQARQSVNATHAYRRGADVDWLIHMDVDEFLVSDAPIGASLSQLPPDTPAARIRPMEALCGDGTAFKRFIPNGPDRARLVGEIYPTFGDYIKGGFVSHLAGKVFVRSGLDNVRLQIHNAFQGESALPTLDPLPRVDLAHCHAKSWEDWLAHYTYRHTQGSYRAELAPSRPREKGGLTLHELFSTLEGSDGQDGLRRFFDEVCADTPALRARLAAHGLLHKTDLNPDKAVATHFPNVTR